MDRIGRIGTVDIHVPFVKDAPSEAVVRWLDEGVGVFERPIAVGHALLEKFGSRVADLACGDFAPASQWKRGLASLIEETVAARRELSERLETGRDRLLEMASLRREVADPLIEEIREQDRDELLDEYFLRLMEHFHVYAEQIADRSYLLNPDAMQSTEFPSLAAGDTAVTLDRDAALVREDLEFVSWDHPLLGDAMDLLRSSEHGNAGFVLLETGTPGLFLESLYVLETVAPSRFHADRFLPATPLRAISDQRARATGDPRRSVDERYLPGNADWIAGHQSTLRAPLTKMAATNERTAETLAADIRQAAVGRMRDVLGGEIARLRDLATKNDAVRPREILEAEDELATLQRYIESARIRLDACRLIWRGPSDRGVPVF